MCYSPSELMVHTDSDESERDLDQQSAMEDRKFYINLHTLTRASVHQCNPLEEF